MKSLPAQPSAKFLFQFPATGEFLTCSRPESAHGSGHDPDLEVRAEVIDAEGMPRPELAACRTQKKAGLRNLPGHGEFRPQHEVDQEKDVIIPLLNPKEAATARGSGRAPGACPRDVFPFHAGPGVPDGLPVSFQEAGEGPVGKQLFSVG